ncbi:alpha-L-fucosidase [Niabella sp. W65]|nr:alpha-L-fucosidase [Niabella sp. W65]MCH7363046.1 alpha-L-fucosidase [Niabella sp. W65]
MNKNEWSEKEKRDTAYYQNLNKGKDMSRYRKYLKDQVTELLTNYGKIDILWMDFSYPGAQGKGRNDWASADLLKTVKSYNPILSLTTGLI